ncbi:MAG: hypothetical protein ABUK19_07650 [Desulfobacteria bacterium]|jgi:hypothetical protein
MGALVAGGQQRRSRGAVVDIMAGGGGVAWVSKRRGLMAEERAFKEACHTRS